MNWKTYPMGGAAWERMDRRGLKAYLSHAVIEPCHDQATALCGVKTHSLCMDDALATKDLPECPRCRQKLNRLASDQAKPAGADKTRKTGPRYPWARIEAPRAKEEPQDRLLRLQLEHEAFQEGRLLPVQRVNPHD